MRSGQAELEALRSFLEKHEDPQSGRPLFVPKITRGPKQTSGGGGGALSGGGGGALPHEPTTPAHAGGGAGRDGGGGLIGDEGSAAAALAALAGGGGGDVGGGEMVITTHASSAAGGSAASGGGGGAIACAGAVGGSSSCNAVVGLAAHLRGDSALISGEALHSARVKQRRSREALHRAAQQQAAADAQLASCGAFTRGRSADLVRSTREARLRALFATLDGASDGVIEGATLARDLDALPRDVADALRPVVSSVANEFLALSDFVDLASRALAAVAPSGPRCSLLPERGGGGAASYAEEVRERRAREMREEQRECSFRPSLDPKSQKLVAKMERSRDVCDTLNGVQVEYAARRAAAQRAALSELEQLCPFRPAIIGHASERRVSGAEPTSAALGRGPLDRSLRARSHHAVATRREGALTSEQIELATHCSFRPRTNHFPGAEARIDTDDPHDSLETRLHAPDWPGGDQRPNQPQ